MYSPNRASLAKEVCATIAASPGPPTFSLDFPPRIGKPLLKRISKDVQGFKRRSRSFTVEVVRKGGAEPPKRPETPARLSQPLRSTPVSKSLRPEPIETTAEIPAPRPWQAAGARIIEAIDQPQNLEIRLEPEPRCGRPGRKKLEVIFESENGTRTAAEAVTAQIAVPVRPKKASAPRKRTTEEIIASLRDPTGSPAETRGPMPVRTFPPETVVEVPDAPRKSISSRAKVEPPRWQRRASRWKERRGVRA